MKIKRSLLASTLFVFLLVAVYLAHIKFFRVNVVLYDALTDAFIAAILAAVILFSSRLFSLITSFEKTLLLIIWLLAGYAWAISGPALIDRSLSFYTLEKLQQRGGGIRLDAIERIYLEEYNREHRLMDVRLTEQLQSGTIIIRDGCVKLTPKGDALASFSRYFRQHFLPKKRLLLNEYTDDLTDPFRNSRQITDYTCR